MWRHVPKPTSVTRVTTWGIAGGSSNDAEESTVDVAGPPSSKPLTPFADPYIPKPPSNSTCIKENQPQNSTESAEAGSATAGRRRFYADLPNACPRKQGHSDNVRPNRPEDHKRAQQRTPKRRTAPEEREGEGSRLAKRGHTSSSPSLSQACSSSSATPLLLAKRVFSLASSPSIFTSVHKIPRHYCSFRASTTASASTSVCLDLKEVRSTDLVDLEYAELNLKYKISEEVGHVRIRQHVNPLSSSFSTPAPVPAWEEVYKDPSLPLMVDIGSGSGRYLLWLAKKNAESGNYLGLEIRQKLVKRANFWVNELGLSNVHFIFANAMVSFEQLISSYPGPLEFVSILCPDPHFKKRHHKRRVVQKPLVNSILQNLKPGGKIFVQSDVLDVAQDMRDQLDEEANVLEHVDAEEGWLRENPMGIRTEREIHAELEGARIYRRLYQKKIQLP